ncbi:MAG TPA: SDR family oxidoreductase [Desulfurococcaceae archaeon]|nr:SDR family oxidoreductase [Desulfurococcaceae archaeon]
MERLGKPEELGWLVAFLASEKASFMNGAVMLIDGGFLRSINEVYCNNYLLFIFLAKLISHHLFS